MKKSRWVLYEQISKHVPCSHGDKLVCVDDKFSKSFKSYLGENVIYNFVNYTTEESKYCSDVMKNISKKKL